MPMLADTADAASYIVQKTFQMKGYVDGRPYYGTEEMSLVGKRIEFLEKLKEKSRSKNVKKKCDELLKNWSDSAIMFP